MNTVLFVTLANGNQAVLNADYVVMFRRSSKEEANDDGSTIVVHGFQPKLFVRETPSQLFAKLGLRMKSVAEVMSLDGLTEDNS